MEYQIAMLLKQHMCDYCKSVVGEKYKDAILTYFPYTTLDEMDHLLDSIKVRFDGIITSGLVPHNLVLSRTSDDDITADFFGFDIENTYRIILQQSMRRKNFHISRIGIDFISTGEDLSCVIDENRLPELVHNFEEWLRAIPFSRLTIEENGVSQRHLERYKNGEIDFIVTYFYSTVIAMQKEGIDCFYLYPNMGEIQRVFDSLIKSIQLRQVSMPAVVRIDLRCDNKDFEAIELQMAGLKKTILEVLSNKWNDIMLRGDYRSIELYMDSHTLKRLTDNMTRCFLTNPLASTTFAGTIGYGVSNNLYHARINAIDASNYASNFRKSKPLSYLISIDEKLTCLMDSDEKNPTLQKKDNLVGISPEWVRQKAKQVRLSPETLTRIIEVSLAERTDRISSSELMRHLGVSLRTANRFLANMHRYGLAEIYEHRHATGKGRPIAVYRILFDDTTN